jgi:NHL repeat
VLKETLSAAGYTESTVQSSSLNNPNGVAVDGNGNIYVSDTGHDRVLKESPLTSGYLESTIASGLSLAADVALDGGGNVYISETDSRLILKVDFADPPSLTFAGTTVGSLSTDSPQTVTVENIGNAAMTFPFPRQAITPVSRRTLPYIAAGVRRAHWLAAAPFSQRRWRRVLPVGCPSALHQGRRVYLTATWF